MTDCRVPRLHLIGPMEGVVAPGDYAAVTERAVRGGVDAVHVRCPGAPGGDVMWLASDIQQRIATIRDAAIQINDRIDVAQLVAGAGVHLGERSIPVGAARRLLGSRVYIGRSVHDVRGAVQAQADGADYVIAGHIYPTESKAGLPGRGLDWLTDVCRSVPIPVIAIGGVRVDRVEEVIAAGAWGVAMSREILTSVDPERSARAVCERIRGN